MKACRWPIVVAASSLEHAGRRRRAVAAASRRECGRRRIRSTVQHAPRVSRGRRWSSDHLDRRGRTPCGPGASRSAPAEHTTAEIAAGIASPPGRAEQHTERGVVAGVDAIEVDDHRGAIVDGAGQRLVELRHGGEVDLTAEAEDRDVHRSIEVRTSSSTTGDATVTAVSRRSSVARIVPRADIDVGEQHADQRHVGDAGGVHGHRDRRAVDRGRDASAVRRIPPAHTVAAAPGSAATDAARAPTRAMSMTPS